MDRLLLLTPTTQQHEFGIWRRLDHRIISDASSHGRVSIDIGDNVFVGNHRHGSLHRVGLWKARVGVWFEGFARGRCKASEACLESCGQRNCVGREWWDVGKGLLRRLSNSLSHRHLLQPGQRVLVAVSGGQDSVSLIYLLCKLQSSWEWKLGIVHCDHQWSPASRSQGSHVHQIAISLGLDYYQAVATRDVSGEGPARAWRYGILQRIAICHGYSAIVTAHTASDRVETLLVNLFRGAGLQGLQSLSWRKLLSPILCLSFRNGFVAEGVVESIERPGEEWRTIEESQISLIRPFLDSSRTEVREFCRLKELPLWLDPTNYHLDVCRNRIRHQLLPYLRKHFKRDIDKSLSRCAEILLNEQQFLESLCEVIRAKAELPYHAKYEGRKLDTVLLQSLPIALQRRIIKQFVENFTGRSIGFDHVERLRVSSLVPGERSQSRMSLPGDVELHFLKGEMLLLYKK
eukprot:c26195_g1_i2 orf=142-1524(-)